MNKFLHVLVYVFLLLAGAALFFEIQLNDKRTLLTDRNQMQEDYLVKIAKTVEKADPAKDTAFEVKKDVSPVEARLVDSPDMDNLLQDYPAYLEQKELATYEWNNQRDALRAVYVLDPENPDGKHFAKDGNKYQTRGSDEEKMLEQLFKSCQNQQSRLNSTRAALTDLRGKLDEVVNELNQLKPEARQDKVTIEEQKAKIEELEGQKADLEGQITRLKSEIDDLNTEITSLKDDVAKAKDETEQAKEEIAKNQKLIEQLRKIIKESYQSAGTKSVSGGVAVSSLPAGDKGVVSMADNGNMFAIVKFSDVAMKELKGENGTNPLPALELSVRRKGFNGAAGEFVGRLRLRQEVAGKNFVICDILGAWAQSEIQKGDVIFAD